MAEEKKERSGGLSLQTLLISAAAAVAAATLVPLIWEQGTLLATAMTPVIVALVSEGLRKPVERVSTVAPRVARRTGTGAALRRFDPDAARTRDPQRVGARGEGPERFEPLPQDAAPPPRREDPYGLRQPERRRPRLRIALVTGALAFLAAAAVVTASELTLFDGSVSGERGRTTLFSGDGQRSNDDRNRSENDRDPSPTATPEEAETAEPTATPTPEPEQTPTPSATPTPAPTEAPPAATPTP